MPHFENATEAAAVWRQPAEMWRWMEKVGLNIGGGGSTSPLTTKGDIWGFTTVDARVPIGSATQIAQVDSSQAAGWGWKTVSADATIATGGALTLATVNSNVGTFGDQATIPIVTVNGKGLTTAVSTTPIFVNALLLTHDSFNRADNASTLGNTTGEGSLGSLAWTTQLGTMGIVNNQAYAPVVDAMATVDLGTGDVDITALHAVTDVNGQAIVLRYTDNSNYIRLLGDNTQLFLQKVVAGSGTTLITCSIFLGTGTVMRVQAQGAVLRVWVDGIYQGSVTDSFNQTATKHGMRMQGTSQRFDEWTASAPPVATAYATGPVFGDLVGLLPKPSLVATGVTAGSYGDSTHVPSLTVDAKGRLTAASNVTALNFPETHSLTGQTADITDTNFFNAGTAGLYRVHVYLADTTSAVGAGSVTANIKYTDVNGAQTQAVGPLVLTSTGFTQATFSVQLASGHVTYGTTHTGIYSTAQYALYVTCERLA